MTKTSIALILPSCLSLMALSCDPIAESAPVEVEPDAGHIEQLAGTWRSSDTHTLTMGTDSLFRECFSIKLPSDPSGSKPDYCAIGRYTPLTSSPVFHPDSCTRNRSKTDCVELDRSLGDIASAPREVLATLRYKALAFSTFLIIEHDCAEWAHGALTDVCVRHGKATGTLHLYLHAPGVPGEKGQISLTRYVNPDSL